MSDPAPDDLRLDELDRRIVTILQDDGRRSSSAIARELGVNERTVRFRIDRMIAADLLAVSAWMNAPRFGLPAGATVIIGTPTHLAREIARSLCEIPEIVYVGLDEPAGSIVLSIYGTSGPAIREYVEREIRTMKGVIDARLVIESELLKDYSSWFPPIDEG
jgi:Lrp/AsnC family transcriptional regulator, regulator for asnA, asnC and gidA